ncbi:hypothetical protein [Rhodobacter sp. NSM]|uniref:hypothetical protein n=1 Tax=Rhodobacter sp. NSM TaxID=3457501 RepID=UPI003FD3A950
MTWPIIALPGHAVLIDPKRQVQAPAREDNEPFVEIATCRWQERVGHKLKSKDFDAVVA